MEQSVLSVHASSGSEACLADGRPFEAGTRFVIVILGTGFVGTGVLGFSTSLPALLGMVGAMGPASGAADVEVDGDAWSFASRRFRIWN
jgi:hypothetical protein